MDRWDAVRGLNENSWYRKTTFLAVLSNTYPPSTGCSMGWTGGMLGAHAWLKLLIKQTKRRLFSQFLHLSSVWAAVWDGEMDGWNFVRSLDENSWLNIEKDNFCRSSYIYPPYRLQYGMDRWDIVRGFDENSLSNIQKDDFSHSSYTYPPYRLEYGMDGWGVCRAMAWVAWMGTRCGGSDGILAALRMVSVGWGGGGEMVWPWKCSL